MPSLGIPVFKLTVGLWCFLQTQSPPCLLWTLDLAVTDWVSIVQANFEKMITVPSFWLQEQKKKWRGETKEKGMRKRQGDSNDNVFAEIHRSVRTSYVQI